MLDFADASGGRFRVVPERDVGDGDGLVEGHEDLVRTVLAQTT